MCFLAIQRSAEVKEILRLTPLRHPEKCKREEIVSALPKPAMPSLEESRITASRNEADIAVKEHVDLAKKTFENRRAGKATLAPSPVLRQLPTS